MSTIRIFPAGLSAAHRVTALLMRTFAHEAITYWVWGWSTTDASNREEELRHSIQIRKPGMRRMYTDAQMYFFIARDVQQHQDLGFSGWCVPTTSNAKHLSRRRTFQERVYAVLARIYDAITAWIPKSIYAYFCPGRANFDKQRKRWVAMKNEVTKSCMRKEHLKQGYWELAYLGVLPKHQGRGLASRLLEWGLEQADRDDRAIYLQATKPAVGFYERHGFKVLARPEVVSADEHGGPLEMIIMCRGCRSEREKD